jgi:hypothetical protein
MSITLTKMKMNNGQLAYTDLSPSEVRQYLSKGNMANAINGWEDTGCTIGIFIAVDSIDVVYKTTVSST